MRPERDIMRDNEAAVMDDDSIILLAPACCHLSASQALDVRHQAGSVSGQQKKNKVFIASQLDNH